MNIPRPEDTRLVVSTICIVGFRMPGVRPAAKELGFNSIPFKERANIFATKRKSEDVSLNKAHAQRLPRHKDQASKSPERHKTQVERRHIT
jgi:hypothetical protein